MTHTSYTMLGVQKSAKHDTSPVLQAYEYFVLYILIYNNAATVQHILV